MEEDRKKLLNLQHLGTCRVAWFEEMGGVVYKVEDMFILFDVSGYGSYINYHKTYNINEIDELLKEAHSWT